MAFTGQPLAASKALASSAAVRGWDRTVETRPRIPNTAYTYIYFSPGPCPAFFPL